MPFPEPRRTTRNVLSSPLCAAKVVLLAIAVGCSAKTGPACFPVHGTVLLDEKPLAEAMIVLHPAGGDMEGKQKPVAYSDAAGRFAVSTRVLGDGAPPGEYSITVELRAPQTLGEETVRNGPNLLPSRYAQPVTSGLRCTVANSENELPPIDLTAK